MINTGNSICGGPLSAPTVTHENTNAPQPGAGRGFLPSPSPQAGRNAYESDVRVQIDRADDASLG